MKIFLKEKCTDDEILFIASEHRKAYLKLFKSALFGQIVFPLALSYVLYSHVSNSLLFGWLAAMLLITFARTYLTYSWYKTEFDSHKTQLFDTLSLTLAFCNGCLWGMTILFMDFNQYPEASVFLNIVIFGLAAASLGIGSYWLESFLVFNISLFFIYIVGYLLSPSGPYYLLATSIVLFLIFIIQIALAFHRSNAQNILLNQRNEKLALNLGIKKQEAEEFAASRVRLLASASHDIRQPLQALNFYLSALYSELKSDKSHTLFLNLEKCAEGMNELLSSILDFSKLEAQTLILNKEACYLNDILKQLKQQFQIQADEKGLTLFFHSSSQYVYSDSILLQRILSNLISNAINYTKDGQVEILLTHDEDLLIEITDTGFGLTELEQEQIFEEFYQLDNSGNDNKKGLGLGLSIVKRLCLLMDIPIKLNSKKGEGSCFSLHLPVCKAPVSLNKPVQLTPQRVIENKKILVIDDEIAIRDGLSELLIQWKCQVIAVESESAACDIIEKSQFHPDLIIADYRLRDNKTGVDAINKVKSLLKQELLPTIIISGDTDPRHLKEAALSGYELLHKPIKPAHLRMLMQQKLI